MLGKAGACRHGTCWVKLVPVGMVQSLLGKGIFCECGIC